MTVEIKVPEVGESVQEAVIAQWYGKEGEWVRQGAVLFVIETDKVTLEVAAEADGVLHILVPEGETVPIGAVVGRLEAEGAGDERPQRPEPARPEQPVAAVPERAPQEPKVDDRQAAAIPGPEPVPQPAGEAEREPGAESAVLAPAVRRLIAEKGVDVSGVVGTGPAGRITKGDVLLYLESGAAAVAARSPDASGGSAVVTEVSPAPEPEIVRKPMSRMRLRIAEHLLAARHNTAMLTTFNEIDMGRVQAARKRYKEPYRERYGVALGFMSFFVKATVIALKEFSEVNAFIDGTDIVYHRHVHMGIAIGAEKGLVVPVIRFADQLSFAEIEQTIIDFVKKIKENRLELSDLEGGTFTISNGGVYGSLLSTPILNAPQSGILGMHKIEERPVVVAGEIVIRPMMYVALSYDHRIVDGREAVTFLKRIKECIEHPERIMLEI